jgi:hypothetical protein
MSSVCVVQYGIHNDVNPTAFCHGLLQLGSIGHCISSIVHSSEQNLLYLRTEADQACATFSVRNSRICTDFRHPVILAADLSVLMCTTATFYYSYFLMVPQPLVWLSLLCEVPRSNSDTPHWVVLLWTSDRPIAETSAWQHRIFTTDHTPVGFEPAILASERPPNITQTNKPKHRQYEL